jgi:hypothetical protein
MMPTEDQAFQFAVMLQAGLPASQAILYFVQSEDPGEIAHTLAKWLKSRAVRTAQTKLTGRAWQEMTLDERCRAALDQHYSGMAWLLFSQHYSEASSLDKGKLDSARMALEAKLAGTAGKQDALSQFFSDINTGKLKLKAETPSKGPVLQ